MVYGKDIPEIEGLIQDAYYLQNSGAFAIVLEMLYCEAADAITRLLRIPTIGIGSGPCTDGQVLVIDDILGLTDFRGKTKPRFVKEFIEANGNPNNPEHIQKAAERFIGEVRDGKYPMPWQYHQFYGRVDMMGLLKLKERYPKAA